MAVDFDAAEPPLPHCPSDHLLDAPGVAFRMDEREPDQPSGVGAHDAGDFGVGLGVVEMEGGEDDSLRDSRRVRAAQVGLDRRLGVPRPGKAIPAANVDNGNRRSRWPGPRSRAGGRLGQKVPEVSACLEIRAHPQLHPDEAAGLDLERSRILRDRLQDAAAGLNAQIGPPQPGRVVELVEHTGAGV